MIIKISSIIGRGHSLIYALYLFISSCDTWSKIMLCLLDNMWLMIYDVSLEMMIPGFHPWVAGWLMCLMLDTCLSVIYCVYNAYKKI